MFWSPLLPLVLWSRIRRPERVWCWALCHYLQGCWFWSSLCRHPRHLGTPAVKDAILPFCVRVWKLSCCWSHCRLQLTSLILLQSSCHCQLLWCLVPSRCATLSTDALQIIGKLWCGVRYFEAYYEGYNETVLGKGYCCVSVPTLPDDDRSYDGQLFGILRCVVLHRAVMLTTCPKVYFFQVEILSVKSSSTDVPLLEATITGDLMWVSQACFDVFHANQNFCLRDHDDKDVPASFYLIHLNWIASIAPQNVPHSTIY